MFGQRERPNDFALFDSQLVVLIGLGAAVYSIVSLFDIGASEGAWWHPIVATEIGYIFGHALVGFGYAIRYRLPAEQATALWCTPDEPHPEFWFFDSDLSVAKCCYGLGIDDR